MMTVNLAICVGKTWFDRLTLAVDNRVLIPRPETEELVHWIVEEHPGFSGNILDIGTGSGAIALALKDRLPDALVLPATLLMRYLTWLQKTATTASYNWCCCRPMCCNLKHGMRFPPCRSSSVIHPIYRCMNRQMHVNVSEHEPHQALFSLTMIRSCSTGPF